ncbi:MAG: nicotinate phosphoribosyltransferase [Bryobacterales bacterium]
MSPPPPPYGQSLALLTDLYELTMAYGYWKSGMAEREAVFHLYFRRAPFGGAFAVACGIGPMVELLRGFRFTVDDLDYLRTLRASDGSALFETAFLEYLHAFEFHCDVDAVREGAIVFPQEPLVRVRGPLLQAQILETLLLNVVNFQTLVATKAARIAHAAQGEQILEFGLRRAQGVDGGLAASRAAYAGGCSATSNVLAGKLYGIPVRGTHAHSWVMSFDSELEAFHAWARVMPANCIFLVDTYDTLEGVRNAIEAGKELRRQGREMLGIRLDSGDLAELSRQARRMLDDAGFTEARVFASGDLDELRIEELRREGAQIAVWGVGTKLVTAYDEPALGGVYKLGAIRDNGEWSDRLKLSDDVDKISNPGVQQVRRFRVDGRPGGRRAV